MLTYLCKYTPVELLTALGVTPQAPNSEAADFERSDRLIHPNVCSHAKMLIDALERENVGTEDETFSENACASCEGYDAARGRRELILTNCCDSIRRVWDSADLSQMNFTFMLDLPHSDSERAVRLYAAELLRLADEYETYADQRPDMARLLAAWQRAAEDWEKIRRGNSSGDPEDNGAAGETPAGRPFVAVLGARVPDGLKVRIEDGLDLPLVDLTCGGVRTLPAPPAEFAERLAAGTLPEREFYQAYAEALLSQIPCTRMQDVGGRDRLTEIPGIAGIVYETVRFCDYYSFEFSQVVKAAKVPVLKVESDYTDQSSGQLQTRIEAFNETLRGLYGTRGRAGGKSSGAGDETVGSAPGIADEELRNRETRNGETMAEEIYVGIDSGSTTTNIAALDADGQLLASLTLRTGPKAGPAAEQAFAELKEQLAAAGHDPAGIRRIIATGYGRDNITFADDVKTEISCHAHGAHHMAPEARTIIDIGGQDSKVISLDEQGNVRNFIMNDKCAAGTGRFLENMARTLQMDLAAMSEAGLHWKKDLTISSTCTVFAESEVVSLIAENAETGDIIHALNKSVAKKTAAMAQRMGGGAPYLMTGGVARNAGVVGELTAGVGAPVVVAEHPDLAGAVGAALYAMS